MRNATLLLLCAVSLVWAGIAAAQTDETAPDETAPPEGGITAEEAAENEAPAETDEVDTPDDDDEETGDTLSQPAELESSDLAEEASEQDDAAEEDEHEPASAQMPFRNSLFEWSHSVTFNSFVRSADLAYNPYYSQSFSLTPRWYLTDTSYFFANEILGVEITDSDSDAVNHDPQLSDTILEFRQVIPWEGFNFMGQLRLTFPVSKASQAAQRYISTGVGVQVARTIPEAYLTLSGSFAYRHWWAGSNVPQSGVDQQIQAGEGLHGCGLTPIAGEAPPDGCDQVSGVSTTRDTLVTGITTTFAYENFSAAFQFLFVNLYGHPLARACVEVSTTDGTCAEGGGVVLEDESNHWRNYIYMALSVSYQFLPWLSADLGVSNAGVYAPAYNGTGNIQSPFNPDTQVFLTGTVQLDALYTTMAGEEDITPEERSRRRQGISAIPQSGGSL